MENCDVPRLSLTQFPYLFASVLFPLSSIIHLFILLVYQGESAEPFAVVCQFLVTFPTYH